MSKENSLQRAANKAGVGSMVQPIIMLILAGIFSLVMAFLNIFPWSMTILCQYAKENPKTTWLVKQSSWIPFWNPTIAGIEIPTDILEMCENLGDMNLIITPTSDSTKQYQETPESETSSCVMPPSACEDFEYSEWGECQPSGTKTRTITSSSPEACEGGNPELSTACTYIPTCTEANWSSSLSPTTCPANQIQTKTWTKIGTCQGGVSHPASEEIPCSAGTETCSFTYSDWSECQPSGTKTRTITSSSPEACEGGNPELSTACTYIPTCTEANWKSSLNPYLCPESGIQTKTWTKIGTCQGGVSHPASERIACEYFPPCDLPSSTDSYTGPSEFDAQRCSGGVLITRAELLEMGFEEIKPGVIAYADPKAAESFKALINKWNTEVYPDIWEASDPQGRTFDLQQHKNGIRLTDFTRIGGTSGAHPGGIAFDFGHADFKREVTAAERGSCPEFKSDYMNGRQGRYPHGNLGCTTIVEKWKAEESVHNQFRLLAEQMGWRWGGHFRGHYDPVHLDLVNSPHMRSCGGTSTNVSEVNIACRISLNCR